MGIIGNFHCVYKNEAHYLESNSK